MPITNNIAWDERLEAFKGRDTTLYVTAAAAGVKKCADCQKPLEPGGALSLIVDVKQAPDFTSSGYRHYDAYICHRECQDPDLAFHEVPGLGLPDELDNFGTRFILGYQDAFGIRNVPCLAFTVLTTVTVREEGGERVSAALSALSRQGFQLSMTAAYEDMVKHAKDVHPGFSCTASAQGTVSLHSDGLTIYTLQLDPADADDALWLESARAGKVLVISGDNLHITETDLDVEAAARLGTLLIGYVAVVS